MPMYCSNCGRALDQPGPCPECRSEERSANAMPRTVEATVHIPAPTVLIDEVINRLIASHPEAKEVLNDARAQILQGLGADRAQSVIAVMNMQSAEKVGNRLMWATLALVLVTIALVGATIALIFFGGE